MGLLDLFMPDEMLESVYAVTPALCEKKGVHAVVFDVDNTLVPYDVPEPDQSLIDHLASFREAGIPLALVSNNTPARVELFNRKLHFFALADAHKPKKSALAPVLAHFSPLAGREVLLVGDQLLTDVLTARRNGICAFVVPPIKQRENLFFRFKRMIEKPLIRRFRRLAEKKRNKSAL